MDAAGYKTVFDVATIPYPDWSFAYVAAGLGGASALAFAFTRSHWRWMLLGATLIVAVFFVAIPYWDFHRLRTMVSERRTRVVEGPIHGYWSREVQRPGTGLDRLQRELYEAFQVGETKFGYYRGIAGSGGSFTNHLAETVPLRDGLHVRIHYIEDPVHQRERRILRFEVADGR